MRMDIKGMESEAGFVMGTGDRFREIVVSDEVRFDSDPDSAAVVSFFVIRRAGGDHDIVCIHKTFRRGECVSRLVQRKAGLPGGRIEAEMRMIKKGFAVGIEAATSFPVNWNSLDLSAVSDPAEQVRLIREWGRVGVSLLPETS
jgi:hypothetical protein